MLVDTFDYELPAELIAQHPLPHRDSSRLLVLHRRTGLIEHRRFSEIGDYLHPGDCLVLNDTRVLPARVRGARDATGGKWEGLFLQTTGEFWELMIKTGGHPVPGEYLSTDKGRLRLQLCSRTDHGTWIASPNPGGDLVELLTASGHIPIPPYIRAGVDSPEDLERYQTVYASVPGAVAAPTAGLHFTPELLQSLRTAGIEEERVTLHVGPGTFQPIKVVDTRDHVMHEEWCAVSASAAKHLDLARSRGGRIIAVGTTSVRTLETACQSGKELQPFQGRTRLFILPPYEFQAVDAMITNFHLPKSTLLMLVCAFAGTEQALEAYREAIRSGYRFYSYGDAMLIL